MRYELYKFTHGSNEWLLNNSRRTIKHGEKDYLSCRGLSRDNIEDSGIDKADFEITLPQMKVLNSDNLDFQELFFNRIFVDAVGVEIIELNEVGSLVLFRGRVTQPSFDEDQKTLVLTVSSDETYQNRNILTRKFQRSCPNKIYDRFCGLSIIKWSSKAKVTAINGLNVTVEYTPDVIVSEIIDENGNHVKQTTTSNTALVDDTVTKVQEIIKETTDAITGEITIESSVVTFFSRTDKNPYSRGLIIKDDITVYLVNAENLKLGLYRRMSNLKVGDDVFIAMGCDQSFESCKTFSNNLRYMGFPFMPNSNPINDQIIK